MAGEWTENKDVGNLPIICRMAVAREFYGPRGSDTEGWLLLEYLTTVQGPSLNLRRAQRLVIVTQLVNSRAQSPSKITQSAVLRILCHYLLL